MKTTLIVAAVVLSVASWLTAGLANAQPKAKPDKAKQAEAQEHYKRALAYKNLKDWDKAISEFEQSHALYPDAEFHFLIAEVHEAKGDAEAAVQRYQLYLDEEPRGRVASKAKAAIDRLRPAVEAARKEAAAAEAARKQAEADEAARTQREADEAARKQAEADAEKQDDREPSGNTDDRSQARPGRGLRIAGLVTGGLGVVGISIGVISGLRAKSAESDLETQFDPSRYDQGKAAETTMFIGYGVGAAALIGGGVMYMLGAKKGKSGGTRVSGTIGAGEAFAFVRGSF